MMTSEEKTKGPRMDDKAPSLSTPLFCALCFLFSAGGGQKLIEIWEWSL